MIFPPIVLDKIYWYQWYRRNKIIGYDIRFFGAYIRCANSSYKEFNTFYNLKIQMKKALIYTKTGFKK